MEEEEVAQEEQLGLVSGSQQPRQHNAAGRQRRRYIYHSGVMDTLPPTLGTSVFRWRGGLTSGGGFVLYSELLLLLATINDQSKSPDD